MQSYRKILKMNWQKKAKTKRKGLEKYYSKLSKTNHLPMKTRLKMKMEKILMISRTKVQSEGKNVKLLKNLLK